jgi:hypothetical protein
MIEMPYLLILVLTLGPITGVRSNRITGFQQDANTSSQDAPGVRMTITSVCKVDGTAPTEQFNAGDKILIRLSMFNGSDEPVSVITSDTMYQHRLELWRDGQAVPPLARIAGLLEYKEREGPGPGRKFVTDPIEPQGSAVVSVLDLGEWYGELEPGQYALTLWYRPMSGRGTIRTNTLVFKIVQ